jgi:hypothetical protein
MKRKTLALALTAVFGLATIGAAYRWSGKWAPAADVALSSFADEVEHW